MDDMKFKESLMEKYDGVNRNAWKKYNSIIKGAEIRNINLNIKFKDYLPFYNTPCFYCGGLGAIGLDRLDSSVGYEKGNIVSCCSTCNMMKGILNPHDFVFQCKKISENSNTVPDLLPDKGLFVRQEAHAKNILEENEGEIIRDCLNRNMGNRIKTSMQLGMSTTTLWRKMKKYKISISISC